jgi:pimeloyl-ACP methyl ester carboxylesterase
LNRQHPRLPGNDMERLKMMNKFVIAGVLLAPLSGAVMADASNVVLVHGATVDGSGWRDVYNLLKAKGLSVSVVQLPHTSMTDDVAATRLVLSQQKGSTVLVGHSYGGAIITEAGTEDTVKALVYVAAFQPEKGETLGELSQRFPTKVGLKMLDKTHFVPDPLTYHDSLGADLPVALTDFMSASAKPMSVETFGVKIKAAAWHTKPGYAIVTTQDRTIAPALLKWMYARSGAKVTELDSSHMAYISHPREVAKVIMDAVKGVD